MPRHYVLLLCAFAAGGGAVGCQSGSARFHVIPLGTRSLAPRSELLSTWQADRCFWWNDEGGRLCVVAEGRTISWRGKYFSTRQSISLVLPRTPEAARESYAVDRETARMISRVGLVHTRAASLSGLVTIWDVDGKRLRGKYRVLGRQQNFVVLWGWRGDQNVLLLGEFRAVHDPRRGEEILRRTEEGALVRRSRPPVADEPRAGRGSRPEDRASARGDAPVTPTPCFLPIMVP